MKAQSYKVMTAQTKKYMLTTSRSLVYTSVYTKNMRTATCNKMIKNKKEMELFEKVNDLESLWKMLIILLPKLYWICGANTKKRSYLFTLKRHTSLQQNTELSYKLTLICSCSSVYYNKTICYKNTIIYWTRWLIIYERTCCLYADDMRGHSFASKK